MEFLHVSSYLNWFDIRLTNQHMRLQTGLCIFMCTEHACNSVLNSRLSISGHLKRWLKIWSGRNNWFFYDFRDLPQEKKKKSVRHGFMFSLQVFRRLQSSVRCRFLKELLDCGLLVLLQMTSFILLCLFTTAQHLFLASVDALSWVGLVSLNCIHTEYEY